MVLLALLLIFRLTPSASVEYKQPQMAFRGELVAATFGSGDSIFFSASRDGGRSFGRPAKVADVAGLMLGRHRGPRVAITREAIVISAVSKDAGNIEIWRSTDEGRTWSRGAAANQNPGSANEGLHAMIAEPDGSVYAIWLDTPGKGKRLMGAWSEDSGATWSKNVLIYQSPDGSICQCCHPSLAIGRDGSLHAMWRNALGGARDMYHAESRDGGRTFGAAKKVGTGSWHLEACPMDGGGMVAMADGKMAAAFRRQQDVFFAMEDQPEVRIATGKDPAIAANKSGVFVAWYGAEGVMAKVPGATEPMRLDTEGAFPQLIALGDGAVLAAWERKGEIEFQRLTSEQKPR